MNHKKILYQVHKRRSLQEVALVKDACDPCFRAYSNKRLLVHGTKLVTSFCAKMCLWIMYSAASKGIWEVFERKTRLFFWFFPPSFLFLKKTSKHIARSLLLLPWKGCIFVLLYFCAFNSGFWTAFGWRPFFSKLILLYHIGVYLLKEKCLLADEKQDAQWKRGLVNYLLE